MTFVFTLKLAGKPLHKDLKIEFTGTREEAWLRARLVVAGLVKFLGKRKFTIRVDRTDAPAKGYEIGPDGHTI